MVQLSHPYMTTGKAIALSIHRSEVVKSLSRVRLFATPWTVAYQAPLSMGLFLITGGWEPTDEFPNGLPFPSPGDLPNPGLEPRSPALWTDALPSEPPSIHTYIQLLMCY